VKSASVLLAVAALLAGCTHYEPLSLHGAGSMRVEVEVYKGPASISPEGQVGQTAAVLSDFVRAADAWHEEAVAFLRPGADPHPDRKEMLEAGPPSGSSAPPVKAERRLRWMASTRDTRCC